MNIQYHGRDSLLFAQNFIHDHLSTKLAPIRQSKLIDDAVIHTLGGEIGRTVSYAWGGGKLFSYDVKKLATTEQPIANVVFSKLSYYTGEHVVSTKQIEDVFEFIGEVYHAILTVIAYKQGLESEEK